MFSAAQFIAHLVGDYLLQSDWMAIEKRKRHLPDAFHAITYALPFLPLTHSPLALAFIAGTHFVVDRYGLARYLCWAKNFVGSPWTREQVAALADWFLAPWRWRRTTLPAVVWSPYRRPWTECTKTGYPNARDAWMTVWLLIIADNVVHLVFNATALEWMR